MRLIINTPKAKRHRSVTYPQLEQALKEFVLIRQHQMTLNDAMLIEHAKLLASKLEIPEGALNFSVGWLLKFKNATLFTKSNSMEKEHPLT